jgi:hypothetical protein
MDVPGRRTRTTTEEHIVPEETTPPEGTPSTPVAPDWDSPDNPYRKRFEDTQSAYTQNQQRLKELERYEQDPQAYYELGAKHGVQFEFEDPNQPAGTEPDQYAQQLTAYEQRIAQLEARAQAESQAAGKELFVSNNDDWAKEAGVELEPWEHNAIFGALIQSPTPRARTFTARSSTRTSRTRRRSGRRSSRRSAGSSDARASRHRRPAARPPPAPRTGARCRRRTSTSTWLHGSPATPRRPVPSGPNQGRTR